MTQRKSERGNIFTVLLAAVALSAVLSMAMYQNLSGPLATMTRVTKKNMADTQMLAASKIAIIDAINQTASGDCDADGSIEPKEWRAGTVGAVPTNGGLIPLTIGAPVTDPWGTDFGYCVWDVGSYNDPAVDQGCGASAKRLKGTDNPSAGLAKSQTVMAIISAGPDRQFNTTCNNYTNGTTDVMTTSGDDVVMRYTYNEAANATSSLWSIKTGAPDTATIAKNLEVTGSLITATAATLSGKLIAGGGVLVGTDAAVTTCNAGNTGLIRYNTTTPGLETCNGTAWVASGGGGAANGFNTNNAVACDGTTIGQVRYNSTSHLPEFCDGTAWRVFSINVPNVNLEITAQTATMNVDGGAACGGAVTCYSSTTTFTVLNTGSLTSSSLNGFVVLSNTSNFQITANTCTSTLAPTVSCTVQVRAYATGNVTYNGRLTINRNNAPYAVLQGTATGFGCVPGRVGGGGLYAACGIADGLGTYDLIVQPSGCNGAVLNPTCAGGTDSVAKTYGTSGINFTMVNSYSDGAQNGVNAMAIVGMGAATFPGIEYCRNMTYNSKTDWYLPARDEMRNYIGPAVRAGQLTGFQNNWYQTSTQAGWNTSLYEMYHNQGDSLGNDNRGNSWYVRCVRKELRALPSVSADATPDTPTFTPSSTVTPGQRVTSAAVTIRGLLQSATVTVSGSGNPAIKINGAAEAASGSVVWGNTLQIVADAPAVAGNEYLITVQLGSVSTTWKLRTIVNQPARVFVSSQIYTANLGGTAGADAKCEALAEAAGIGGHWKAILGVYGVNAIDRFPWNFTSIVNMNPAPQTVATSVADFWDGALAAPINYTENKAFLDTTVWTGSTEYGSADYGSGASNDQSFTCSAWTQATGENAYYGKSALTNAYWAKYAANEDSCTWSKSIYCIESDPSYVDTAPNPITFVGQNLYSSAGRVTSNTVTISGVAAGQNLAVVLSGSAANKAFTVNGGAEVTSGTVQLGDTLALVMDFPADGASTSIAVQVGTGASASWTVTHLASNANCKAILDNGNSTGDGTYTIDSDGASGPLAPMSAYCDMTTDGGGWTMIMNYVHQGGTYPARAPRATTLPIPNMAAALGTDESANGTRWGHAVPSLLGSIPFGELRFYCTSSRHGRVVHFKTSFAPALSYAKTGLGTASGLASNFTPLTGSTANLPGSSDGYGGDQGNYSLTDHMFLKSSLNYWHIGVANQYWLCDDDGGAYGNYHTIHRIWVR